MEQRKRSWLTRRDKVELFEQIRREHEFGVGTISRVSRNLDVHRRLVREALSSAVPVERKPHKRRLRRLEAATPFIDRVLMEDQHAPLKQRHIRCLFRQPRTETPLKPPKSGKGLFYEKSNKDWLWIFGARR